MCGRGRCNTDVSGASELRRGQGRERPGVGWSVDWDFGGGMAYALGRGFLGHVVVFAVVVDVGGVRDALGYGAVVFWGDGWDRGPRAGDDLWARGW